MRMIQFGDVVLPEFNGRQEFSTQFRSSIVTLQGGGFDNDGTNTYLLPKVVNASFFVSVKDGNPIDATIEALYREAGQGQQQIIAERRDGTLLVADGKVIDSSISEDARFYFPQEIADKGDGYARMSMSIEIPYPYWLKADDSEIAKLNDGYLLNNDVHINAENNEQSETITGSAHTFTITNSTGNARVYKGVITVIVNSGSVTDFRITNLTTGELVEFAAPLATNDILVIDLLPMTVTKNGADAYRFFIMGQDQMDFLHLELGANNFQIDGVFSAASVSFSYKWSSHYVR